MKNKIVLLFIYMAKHENIGKFEQNSQVCSLILDILQSKCCYMFSNYKILLNIVLSLFESCIEQEEPQRQ